MHPSIDLSSPFTASCFFKSAAPVWPLSRELRQEVHLMLTQPDSHRQAMHSHSPTVYGRSTMAGAVQGKFTMRPSARPPALLTHNIMLQKYNSVIMPGRGCRPSWLRRGWGWEWGMGWGTNSTVPSTAMSTSLGLDCVCLQDSVSFSVLIY